MKKKCSNKLATEKKNLEKKEESEKTRVIKLKKHINRGITKTKVKPKELIEHQRKKRKRSKQNTMKRILKLKSAPQANFFKTKFENIIKERQI